RIGSNDEHPQYSSIVFIVRIGEQILGGQPLGGSGCEIGFGRTATLKGRLATPWLPDVGEDSIHIPTLGLYPVMEVARVETRRHDAENFSKSRARSDADSRPATPT